MAKALVPSVGCTSGKLKRNSYDSSPPYCIRLTPLVPEMLSFRMSVSNHLAWPTTPSKWRPRGPLVQVSAVMLYPTSMAWWKKGNQPNMQEINSSQEFVKALTNAGEKLVLVDFYSVSCRSCKALHPKICQIAADNPDIDILKVNFYENTALCRSLNVCMLPFFHLYRGKEGRIDAFSCSLTKIDKLRVAVAKHKPGHLALPAPGPVAPVVNKKDIMVIPTPVLASAASAF